jgi:bidirectional [NiFe] hydrogenase diaphorase subunit
MLKAVSHKYHIKDGQTTEDGALSLLSARCIGACGLAPAAVVDGDVAGKGTAQDLLARLDKLERKG